MSDEIGSVMMDAEEELVAPEIPIRPNAAIPITAAVILLLGAMMTAYSGITTLLTNGDLSDDEIDNLVEAFNESEANVSGEQLRQYSEDVQDSLYSKVSPFLDIGIAGLLATGGILLLRGERRGVRIGASGAGLVVLTSLWSAWIKHQAAANLPQVVALTFTTMSVLFAICGLFCLGAAFLPLMFASGRAALSSPTLLETLSIEEE
jgi:hypothetical protein